MMRAFIIATLAPAILYISNAMAMTGSTSLTLSNGSFSGFELDQAFSSETFQLQVSPGSELSLQVTSDNALEIVITDPLGNDVAAAEVQISDQNDTDPPPLGASAFSTAHHARFNRTNHLAGNWTIAVTLPAGIETASGYVTSTVSGGTIAAITTSHSLYNAWQDFLAVVPVMRDGQPVSNAVVTVDVYRAGDRDSPLRNAQLYDNGSPPDVVAGDGLYTGTIPGFSANRTGKDFVAEATVVTPQDNLSAFTSFEVRKTAALRYGAFERVNYHPGNPYGINGLQDFVDNIEFTSTIDNSYIEGLWEVQACLEASNERALCKRQKARSYDYQSIVDTEVRFTAQEIREYLGVDGPYSKYTTLFEITDDGLTTEVDRLAPRPSNPYRVHGDGSTEYDLLRPHFTILPGLMARLIDEDDDGIIDFLDIDLQFECLILSSCLGTISASLDSPQGVQIRAARTTFSATRGIQTATLRFAGSAIAGSRLDGPYAVNNVTLRDTLDRGHRGTYLDSLGQTGFYSYAIFSTTAADYDLDGYPDEADNCPEHSNPDQANTDDDAFGNRCDPDFDQSGIVDVADLTIMRQYFLTATPNMDLDGNNFVDNADLAIMREFFLLPPGPGRQ
ncbi:MAG: thrombospondin type 3 repeat-containing protein [Gammaproteobacteria bacterium]|nr:thrombospondin type 3 repeat-containing protein [Gammaproteobacteria bacterium]NNF62292.1 hypothetical protein [Gammaproteobacteria bacterium]NNM21245.1 hypothetical protein [Gammaproteobacteria bacterium]